MSLDQVHNCVLKEFSQEIKLHQQSRSMLHQPSLQGNSANAKDKDKEKSASNP